MSTLFSARWHRVASLRPRLEPTATPRRQRLRGDTWIVLADPRSTRSVRLNAAAWAIAGRMDGRATVQQLWDAALVRDAEPPSQDEVIALLARLREASLLQLDRAADFDLLLPQLQRASANDGAGARWSLLSWRLPLGNPAALLARLRPLQDALFSRPGFFAWLAGMVLLVLLAAQHAPELQAHARQCLATPRYALLALALYAPIKLVHELAHGLALRRRGGGVRAAGVTLMMLMPVPWVDASAAATFPRRRDRVLVGAAGMMAELALAAAALPVWLWLADGLARDAAFVTLTIAGVSTLLFNANPLQKLDGYFILCDALALPNLASRSRQWWIVALQRALLGASADDAMPLARGERPWLAAYAPLAWLCAVGLAALAVSWVGAWSLPLGIAAGALLGWQVLLRPPFLLLRQLRRTASARGSTARRWRRLAACGALAVLAVALLPWPRHTIVQGVVWPADEAQLRAREDGFVETLLVHDGQRVEAGDVVLRMADPALAARVARQAAHVAALETTLVDALPGQDGVAAAAAPADGHAGDARAELDAAQAELARLNERAAGLVVRALCAGRVALGQPADLDGRFFHRGALIGQVLTNAAPLVRVAWPAADADLLGADRSAVSVRLASARDRAWPATVARDGAGAVRRLPSAALSDRHGGPIATDPADSDDLRPLQPVVLVDVRLPARAATAAAGAEAAAPAVAQRIGERAWVRFDAGFAPLAWQALAALRRQAAQRFNPRF